MSRRGRRILIGVVSVLLVIVLGAGGTAWWMLDRVSGSIERIPDAFSIPEEQRPTPAEDGSLNILLAGLDGEDSADEFERGAARTDAIMVLHITAGRDDAYLISIPRDTWIPIPDHGENKINAAYSLGGPSLYVQTIEQLAGLRMDHLAVIDWSGFRALTDALGGVELEFDTTVVTADDTTYQPGVHVLDGNEALQYVRERKALPGGDFDRIKRQQNFLRALMGQLLSDETMSSPGKLWDVAGTIGRAAKVDEDLSATDMVGLGTSLRGLRSDDLTFLTVPTLGTGWAGSASIVVYDQENADLLWDAVRADDVEPFLAEHAELVTGSDVR